MGASIGTAFSTAMADKQKEMQGEMQEKQVTNMLRQQERMRRMQAAQQLAMARERFYWIASAYGVAALALTASAIKSKKVPLGYGAFVVPTIVVAYQYDYVWGGKLERIQHMQNEMLKNEDRWFTHLTPTDAEVEKLKKL